MTTLAAERAEGVRWIARVRLEKREGDWSGDEIDAGLAPLPFDVVDREGNLLVIGGASALWEALIGNGTGTAGQPLTFFNNGNAYIGVGDSSTAAADTQTDLQAATNKLRVGMDSTYPQHTDSTGTSGSKSISFRATFGSAQANFAWNEWAILNGSSGGRMLNRKAESFGTKSAGSTWTLTVTLSLA